MSNLFKELKRCNVVRVGTAHLLFGWLLIQIGGEIIPTFSAPAARPFEKHFAADLRTGSRRAS